MDTTKIEFNERAVFSMGHFPRSVMLGPSGNRGRDPWEIVRTRNASV
jgi:hypothetical protein